MKNVSLDSFETNEGTNREKCQSSLVKSSRCASWRNAPIRFFFSPYGFEPLPEASHFSPEAPDVISVGTEVDRRSGIV